MKKQTIMILLATAFVGTGNGNAQDKGYSRPTYDNPDPILPGPTWAKGNTEVQNSLNSDVSIDSSAEAGRRFDSVHGLQTGEDPAAGTVSGTTIEYRIMIRDVPVVGGTREYNLALGGRRAQTSREFGIQEQALAETQHMQLIIGDRTFPEVLRGIADQAGLSRQQIAISRVDGTAITSLEALRNLLRNTPSGQTPQINIHVLESAKKA